MRNAANKMTNPIDPYTENNFLSFIENLCDMELSVVLTLALSGCHWLRRSLHGSLHRSCVDAVYPTLKLICDFWPSKFSHYPSRPATRSFCHYPTRSRPEVKNHYPSGPVHHLQIIYPTITPHTPDWKIYTLPFLISMRTMVKCHSRKITQYCVKSYYTVLCKTYYTKLCKS